MGSVLPGDGEAETQLLAWSWLSAPPGPQDGRPWDERVPPPDGDATLLAVVPIPGTGTSVAIVGYVMAAPRGKQQAGSGLRLDHLQRRVWVDGDEIQLTFQEFELLAFLAAHPSTVFTRAGLVERVWHRNLGPDGRPVPQDSRTVDVHVSRVRRKLGPHYGQYLVTEYRVGYQFRPPPP
jgi:hypothetical protein